MVTIALEAYILICVIAMFVFALDDLLIDVLALVLRARPRKIEPAFDIELKEKPQKMIAIMVANWKEEDVITAMVKGNLARVEYSNYYFFLGVYPNDVATRDLALELGRQFPQVVAVVNSKPGPTSKGQMVNECARAVFREEAVLGFKFDALMIHDSEDVIHPRSLQLVNSSLDEADFVQIPVFSFEVPHREIVGAIYMDEFSEHHSKEMLVRSQMRQAVPSAGTGTAMSRRLCLSLMEAQSGGLLKEDTLTEDYHLGNLSHRLGFRTSFVCRYFVDEDGRRDFIATREYFPKAFWNSIRQKTRWCIGIIFQGGRNLGWSGGVLDRYFLWRDRRGFGNTIVIVGATIVLGIYIARMLGHVAPLPIESNVIFRTLIAINIFAFALRLWGRIHAVAFINGAKHAPLVPVRWFIANLINSIAMYRAWRDMRRADKKGEAPKWVKTQHELPKDFGVTVVAPQTPKPVPVPTQTETRPPEPRH